MLEQDIKQILFSEEELKARVAALAAEICPAAGPGGARGGCTCFPAGSGSPCPIFPWKRGRCAGGTGP